MRGLCVAMMQARPAATDQVINMHIFAASLRQLFLCTHNFTVLPMIRSFESALASNGAALHLVAGALLTECSIVTAMLRWTCRHTCRVAEAKSAPSMAAMQLLDVSLKTAAVPGGTAAAVRLLEGIAAAGGVAAYLNACLAVTLSYGER